MESRFLYFRMTSPYLIWKLESRSNILKAKRLSLLLSQKKNTFASRYEIFRCFWKINMIGRKLSVLSLKTAKTGWVPFNQPKNCKKSKKYCRKYKTNGRVWSPGSLAFRMYDRGWTISKHPHELLTLPHMKVLQKFLIMAIIRCYWWKMGAPRHRLAASRSKLATSLTLPTCQVFIYSEHESGLNI